MANSIVHTQVSDCMTQFVITVGLYDNLARAWELMSVNDIRRLPVMHNKELVGIITQRDVLRVGPPAQAGSAAQLTQWAASLEQLIVSTAMSSDAIHVYPNDTLGHAAELMLEHKIGGLPVVDANGELVGLITESNIFRALVRRWHEDNITFSGARNIG